MWLRGRRVRMGRLLQVELMFEEVGWRLWWDSSEAYGIRIWGWMCIATLFNEPLYFQVPPTITTCDH